MKFFCKHWNKQVSAKFTRKICRDCPLRAKIEAGRRLTAASATRRAR